MRRQLLWCRRNKAVHGQRRDEDDHEPRAQAEPEESTFMDDDAHSLSGCNWVDASGGGRLALTLQQNYKPDACVTLECFFDPLIL